MKYFYAIGCVLGALLPYGLFVPWAAEHGIDIPLFLAEAGATRIGAFAWMDVVVSAAVLIGFIVFEGGRQKMGRLWLPILGTVTVGVSFGLPLFLLQRELHLARS